MAALPIRACFADGKLVAEALLDGECPRDLGTIGPLVDSFHSVYKGDLHIVPVVLVVLIALNNIVADEAFNRLDSANLGSRLGSRLRRRRSWCGLRSWFSAAASASAASSLRLPFLGITTRPGPFARGAAWCMATVLIVLVPAVITPVQLVALF